MYKNVVALLKHIYKKSSHPMYLMPADINLDANEIIEYY